MSAVNSAWLSRMAVGALAMGLLAGPVRAAEPTPDEPTPAEPAPKKKVDPALAAKRDKAQTLVKRGQELAAMGRAEDALEAFRAALAAYPAYPLAYHELGVTLAEMKDLGEAEANLRRALELAPGFVRAQQALGEVLRRQKRWDEALAQYELVLDGAPADLATWYGVASCLRQKKQDGEALWALEQLIAVAESPDAPAVVEARKERDALAKAGVVARVWGATPAPTRPTAEPDVGEMAAAPGALTRHPGDSAFAERRYLAALEAYLGAWGKQVKGARPDAVLAYKIGATFAVMNDGKQALAWWRTSLAADPGRELVARHLALLLARMRGGESEGPSEAQGDALVRARAALRAGDPGSALWLAQGLDLPGAATIEGEARLRLGDFARARAIFEEVLGEDPDDRVAKGGLAETLLRMGQAGAAEKAIQAWLGSEGSEGGYKARPETFLVLRRGEVDARLLAPEEPED